jgi:ABC-2 type transport system ATP-binding protein
MSVSPSDSAASWAIDVRGMTKRFDGRTVVNQINLRVREGQIYGFLGPNGSGKTTFIRMLCGLLRADGGEGTCLGFDVIRESAAIKRQVGYMTQRFSFYEDLTIEENLAFVARVYGVPDPKKAVAEGLEHLGLAHRKKQLAGQLSGGWKQRMALAACLLHKPRLLLLDEPTAGVDPKARRDFWDEIHGLAEQGLTFLVTTHYMDEAELCDRLAYISLGNLLVDGTPAEVVQKARLVTWSVTGPRLSELAQKLRAEPGVEQAVAFGKSLHVSGGDAEILDQVIARYMTPDHEWTKVPACLEDAFIHLMQAK